MGAVNTDAVHVLIVDDQQPFRSAARMVVELAEVASAYFAVFCRASSTQK
jgi:hypothetical protein